MLLRWSRFDFIISLLWCFISLWCRCIPETHSLPTQVMSGPILPHDQTLALSGLLPWSSQTMQIL